MRLEKAYYWPEWLIKSLSNDYQNNDNKFNKAQLALWQSLNIYDDIIDNDKQTPDLMLANHNFREFLELLYSSNLPSFFIKLANKSINDWEKINQLEQRIKKLKIKNNELSIPNKLPPNYHLSSLSKKSLPLAVLPIAQAIKLKLINSPEKIKIIFNIFKYALSAKQLSDDASDWLTDLKNGLINPVNLLVLKAAKSRKIKISFKSNPEIVYLLFSEAAGTQTAKNIINLCKRAKKEALKIKIAENAPFIKNLVQPLILAAEKSLKFKKML